MAAPCDSRRKSIGFSLREILAFSQEMTDGVLDHARAQESLRSKINREGTGELIHTVRGAGYSLHAAA